MESGKFVLRLNPELHKSLKAEAKTSGESLNSLCIKKLLSVSSTPWTNTLKEIITTYDPLGIILFGSYARGEDTKSSDIDLLIVLDKKSSIERSLYQKWDQLKNISDKFSPQFVHLVESDEVVGGIWLEASLDGEVLFMKDASVKSCLNRIRKEISQGVYQRKTSHGHPYWVNLKFEKGEDIHEE
jgi:predicted nucleotidyltransferase